MNITRNKQSRLYAKKVGFVTLKDVYTKVKAGEVIKVTCAKTRNDITTDVLRECLKFRQDLNQKDLYAILRQ